MAPPTEQGHKVFNDPIHGSMKLHPLLVKIIDTPQFQRLRYLKQLGATYWVFPGASHNRFEHCIGVCYLAGQLVKALKERQPELNITEEDVLCVQVAGLCHDLGHGPFSHMFDKMFIPRARPGHEWTHEKASVEMFDHLVDVGLRDAREKDPELFEILNDINRVFIKEMIYGPLNKEEAESNEGLYKGRGKDKAFLYQIVANKRNGIDVDKWDYFARDCHHLGIQNYFDHRRFIEFARVCEVKDEKNEKNEEKQICIRDKEVSNVYDMLHTRNSLYLKACNHRVCNIIEIMITEAFVKADSHILFEGSNGKMVKLSETIDDMVAYTKVTDHVFYQLLTVDLAKAMEQAQASDQLKTAKELVEELTEKLVEDSGEFKKAKERADELKKAKELAEESGELRRAKALAEKLAEKLAEDSEELKKAKERAEELAKEGDELKKAKEILEKITKRDFYKFVGETRLREHMPHSQKQCRTLEAEIAGTEGPSVILGPDDLVVNVVTVDHRVEKKINPLDNVLVYSKYDPNRGKAIPKAQRHRHLPDSLAEQLIRVYCKKTDNPSMEAARRKFAQWCVVHAHTKWMEISTPPEEEASGAAGSDEQQPDEDPDGTGSSASKRHCFRFEEEEEEGEEEDEEKK